jgi:hypothetical protein
MKKKKMYESHLNTMEQTQFNVESVHLQTQVMKDNMEIVFYNIFINIILF